MKQKINMKLKYLVKLSLKIMRIIVILFLKIKNLNYVKN